MAVSVHLVSPDILALTVAPDTLPDALARGDRPAFPTGFRDTASMSDHRLLLPLSFLGSCSWSSVVRLSDGAAVR